MDLSTVEQRVSDAVEEVGNLIGWSLLRDRHFGAAMVQHLQPVIQDVALMYGDCFNAAAVMADGTQPLGTEP
jgi:hypothetical protein